MAPCPSTNSDKTTSLELERIEPAQNMALSIVYITYVKIRPAISWTEFEMWLSMGEQRLVGT